MMNVVCIQNNQPEQTDQYHDKHSVVDTPGKVFAFIVSRRGIADSQAQPHTPEKK